MKIIQLDHINIAAPAELLGRVRQFYIDLLGFTDGPRPEFSSRGSWLYVNGQSLVHLSETAGSDSGKGHLDHVAFRGQGLVAMKRRLEEAGVSYRSNFIEELEMTQLFFDDPAGTGLEVNFPGER